AILKFGNKSCDAKIQIHEGILSPLLSFSHCQELDIISPDFPKRILAVTNVNRCAELSLRATTLPSADFFLCKFRDVLVSKADLQAAPLKKMVGHPMMIHLINNAIPFAIPFAIHTPQPIPFAFQSQVKEEFYSMVKQGNIKLAGHQPSEWCHAMVLAAKSNGVKITVDLT
ncbi:hypothetical protein SK128_023559, partial [Halocaridina rubra]